MFTTLFSVSLVLTLVRSVLAQSDLTITTPTFVQCQQTNITWTDSGNPPYDLLIVPADDECGEALVDLGNQTSTFVTWNVTIAAGTQVVVSLQDAAGDEAWSGNITVGDSSDSSCLTSTSPASISGTILSAPPTGSAATPTAAASPTSSVFAPVGAAGAGLVPNTSGAPSTGPLSALVGSAVLAAVTLML